jgi:hypothetical protein
MGRLVSLIWTLIFDYSVVNCPSKFKTAPRMALGTALVAVLPPGQRTHTSVGGSGVPKTCTAPSCDQ